MLVSFLVVGAGFGVPFGARAAESSNVIFSDDFNDNSIDSTKWTTEGARVFEQDGVMNVTTDVTDAGGKLSSKWFPINGTQPITISRKTLQHYGNETHVGFFRMYFDANNDGVPDVQFGLNYANNSVAINYGNNYSYCARHGIFLDNITATNLTGIYCNAIVSPVVPGIWDTWFNEELTYDPVSGLVSYRINGEQRTTLNVGALLPSASYRMQLFDQAWGWYTGHYNHFDDVSVTQSTAENNCHAVDTQWLAQIHPQETVIPLSTAIKDGRAYIPPYNTWTGWSLSIPQFIDGDNVRIDIRMKAPLSEGAIPARDPFVGIVGTSGEAQEQWMADSWGLPWTGLHAGNTNVTGDINSMVQNFDDWHVVSMQLRDSRVSTMYDSQMAYSMPYTGSIGILKAIGFGFKGSGSVDWVRIYQDDMLVFDEEFNADGQSTAVVCRDAPAPFTCGTSTVQDVDGNTYGTTDVNGQCWMTENMRAGTMVTGATTQTDNGTIEKYCYNNDPANCTTDGGLYQWDEAMQYSTTEGAQGICSAGWHVPTDAEQYALENYLKNPGATCDADRLNNPDVWGCDDAGARMKLGAPPDLNFPLIGYRIYNGSGFYPKNTTNIWSSSLLGELALNRRLDYNVATVNRAADKKAYGVTVRCVRNSDTGEHVNHVPIITLNGDSIMTLNAGDAFPDPGATAHDEEDGDISAKIVKSGDVDTSKAGTYTITYNVKDSKDLAAEAVMRTVMVNATVEKPQCSDGIDNDGDGKIDAQDLACHTDFDPENQATYSADNIEDKNTDMGILQNEKPHYSSGCQQPIGSEPDRNLIVITHGLDDNAAPGRWVDTLSNAIKNKINENGQSDKWAVCEWDWRFDASLPAAVKVLLTKEHVTQEEQKIIGATYAYTNAENQGINLGKMLVSLQPRSIHFIAHSAGSNLIQHAEETVLQEMPIAPPVIHMTFLDAYTPNESLSNYGQNADYAEQYVDSRLLPFTDTQLYNAINFDVTLLGGDAGWYDGIKGHGWPIEYYLRTVDQRSLPGFPFALEYGAKNSPLYKALPASWRGSACIATRNTDGTVSYPCLGMFLQDYVVQPLEDFIDSIPEGIVDTFNAEKQVLVQAINTDVYYIRASATGIVNFVKSTRPSASTKRIHLKKGSPAWISFDVNVTASANVLDFTYEFPGNSSNGLFTIFVDGHRIYSRDESLMDHDKSLSDSAMLPDPLMVGKHTVVFRLDPLSESNSEIFIDNARFANVTSQEKSTEPIQIDTIPPTTTFSPLGTSSDNDWYTSDVTVTLSATDNDGGVGVKDTQCSIDGGEWKEYADPFTISDEGKHIVKFFSEDWFGNKEDVKTQDIKIDKTAPEVAITNPTNNATLYGSVDIKGSVTDINPDHYELTLLDSSGALIFGSDEVSKTNSFTDEHLVDWDMTKIPDGVYVMKLEAEDLAGNKGGNSIVVTLNNTPDNKDQCKDDGWKNFYVPKFKNQGDCVSFIESNSSAKSNKTK